MINALLGVIEETAIQEIDLTHPDVLQAIDIWDEQSVAVQSRGWWYNTETYQLVPDTVSGEVYLPAGCLEIDGASTNYVKKGRKLYDMENHTLDFSEATESDLLMVCIMEWDLIDLPPTIYRQTLIASKLAMVTDRDQDQVKMEKYNAEYQIAEALSLKANLRFSDPNRQSVNNAATLLQNQPIRRF